MPCYRASRMVLVTCWWCRGFCSLPVKTQTGSEQVPGSNSRLAGKAVSVHLNCPGRECDPRSVPQALITVTRQGHQQVQRNQHGIEQITLRRAKSWLESDITTNPVSQQTKNHNDVMCWLQTPDRIMLAYALNILIWDSKWAKHHFKYYSTYTKYNWIICDWEACRQLSILNMKSCVCCCGLFNRVRSRKRVAML